MSSTPIALLDQSWEKIKAAIMDPGGNPLPEEQMVVLHRVTSLAKIIDRHPIDRSALAIHMAKYPDISRRTAGRDLYMARELNVSYHSFNYDFWHNWLISDIVDQIQSAKARGDMRSWSAGHANLIKVIGERVPEEKDPKLVEKHTFLIQINNIKGTATIDTREIDSYPPEVLKQISDSIYTEITEEDAREIFKT